MSSVHCVFLNSEIKKWSNSNELAKIHHELDSELTGKQTHADVILICTNKNYILAITAERQAEENEQLKDTLKTIDQY